MTKKHMDEIARNVYAVLFLNVVNGIMICQTESRIANNDVHVSRSNAYIYYCKLMIVYFFIFR